MRILLVVAAAAGLLAACSKPSEPSNPAVAADQNREAAAAAAAPGDNSFTEDQARGHLVNAGYTDVGSLTQDADGKWTGMATKDGKAANVSVDYQGTITPAGDAAPAQ